MSDLRVITFDGNNVALYDNGSYILVKMPIETIIGTVEKCPTSQVTYKQFNINYILRLDLKTDLVCFVFFVECELHQTNCKYSLIPSFTTVVFISRSKLLI